jgi:hypothetical protein
LLLQCLWSSRLPLQLLKLLLLLLQASHALGVQAQEGVDDTVGVT